MDKKKFVSTVQLNKAYYAFLDAMPAFTFIQNTHKKSIFFNHAWLKFTGTPTVKKSQPCFLDVIHPDDHVIFEHALNESESFEFRLRDSQGKYCWVCDHRAPLFDKNEVLIGYLNQCYDIHESKLKRDAMMVRGERHYFAVHSTGIGVWDLVLPTNKSDDTCVSPISENTNRLFWNDNMFQIYHVNPGDFKGEYQDFERCVHPDDRKKVEGHIAECLQTKEILKIQFRIISHPNEIRYISAQAKVSVDQDGKPIRLTGINQDITESTLEKINIKALHQELYEREKKYRALFESSGDAIMLLSEGQFVECNDATLSMFGCPDRRYFLGACPSDFSTLKQPSGQSSERLVKKYIQQALKKGKASFLWTHRRLNGDAFKAEVLLTPVNVQNKKLIQATVRDITKLAQLQEKLTFLSNHDQLTGLYNRNGLMHFFPKELERSKRYDHDLSILLLDIDFFKSVNDTYGHQAGDKILTHLANTLLSTIREGDVAIRFGGEEFVILLPETNRSEAKKLAERIRQNVETSTVSINKKKWVKYTISLGIATYPESGKNQTKLLASADKALYRAKASGRNQVILAKNML